jgi:hypothetical protein
VQVIGHHDAIVEHVSVAVEVVQRCRDDGSGFGTSQPAFSPARIEMLVELGCEPRVILVTDLVGQLLNGGSVRASIRTKEPLI